ncbi:hypothetical protein ACKWTF_003223 [Chironomus riparius]
MKFLSTILLMILINGYSAKKCFFVGSKINSHDKNHDHGNRKTTTQATTTTTSCGNTTDPFENMVSFNASDVANIKLELMSAMPNLTQNEFDEIVSAMNIIYTLFTQLPTALSSEINSIIYTAYITGTLNSTALANISTILSSSSLQISQTQIQSILSAIQLLYGVASNLPIGVVIDISTITASASGIILPPQLPPFQNMSTFNATVTENIKAELAEIITMTASQQEYLIAQINTIYTVVLQLPASASSKIFNTFISAFVTGSTSLDAASIATIESDLLASLPNLTTTQFKSVTSALKFMFESSSTLPISSVMKILEIVGSASGIVLPLSTLIFPAPFENMSTFDSSYVSSIKQEFSSEISNFTSEQLDFVINEVNILYTIALRLNNDSIAAIQDIAFNAAISGETYLDSSALSEISSEISAALPDITKDQMNAIIFAMRFLYELAMFLPINTLNDILELASKGSGIYVPPPVPPFDNIVSLDPTALLEIKDILQSAFPNSTQTQLDSMISNLNIFTTIYNQLPIQTITTIKNVVHSAVVTRTSTFDSQTLSNITNELKSVMPSLNQTQIGSILSSAKALYDVSHDLPFDKFFAIASIVTNSSSIAVTLRPPPFDNLKTFDSTTTASIEEQLRAGIPTIVQFQMDIIVSQLNVLYTVAAQLPTGVVSNINDVIFNEFISLAPNLDAATLNIIDTEITSVLPNLTSYQRFTILLAAKVLYVVAYYFPISVLSNIANITAYASNIHLNEPLDIVPLDSANIAAITENLIAGIPSITQSQIDSAINDINVLYTIYTQLPVESISQLNDLAYNVSLTASSSLDPVGNSNITEIIKAALPNVTNYQMSTVLNAINNLSQVAGLLPLNILINITGILTSPSGFNLPLPVAPFDNMLTFSTATTTSIKDEILAAIPSILLHQQEYIIFQMNIAYTVASQLPISAITNINNLVFAEFFYSSPYLDASTVTNITNDISTSLPTIDPRQLKSFVYAIEYLYVMSTPLQLSNIISIYSYAGTESNITGPLPVIPPVFKDTTDFTPSVIASIVDILSEAFTETFSFSPSTTELESIIYSLNSVYNVAQRVPISTSTAIQEVLYNLFMTRVGYIDASATANITQELQSALPNLNIYQSMMISSSFQIIFNYANLLPINDVLRISVITANASNIALPSPSPILVQPIPDDEAVDNITALIKAMHPDVTILQMNDIVYQIDLIYTVAKMLPTEVVLNISATTYFDPNGPPMTSSISEALQNITGYDSATQIQIQNLLLPAVPNFTISQINDVMSAINFLHSVARSLNAYTIGNIISIAYDIMGLVEPSAY